MPELDMPINRCSAPSQLRITDMRFVELSGVPLRGTLVKIYTNQGITGVGEIRDFGSYYHAALLKGRLLGENPCNVEKLFKRIKQHGGPARQGGGVSGIEIALWDLAGKAYGVPIYQMLGGKYRDSIRIYCDLGTSNPPRGQFTGREMGKTLKKYVERDGFTMVKAVLSVEDLQALHPSEVVLSAPKGLLHRVEGNSAAMMPFYDGRSPEIMLDPSNYADRNRYYYDFALEQPYTFYRITERGLELYEQELADMREELGYEIPLAIDHV
ncbi:MAG: mandelate racemase/muconate lactonizing enzyme family protein, partial [Christensenellaceae bacterium]|nr:mandelate racemase/muconate lactonizing enzyme family protein [Christensenellaceae bacterium]